MLAALWERSSSAHRRWSILPKEMRGERGAGNCVSGLSLSPTNKRYGWRAHDFAPLPTRNCGILACFLERPHDILRSFLLHVGWPDDIRTTADRFPQMHRIRQAIDPDPRRPQLLVTRWEADYLLPVTPVAVEFGPISPIRLS